uniref:Tetratricopeptide repeat protein 27 n=1 Tax=Aceria tosichella TaxID=561515 RepID=A0A6G1SLV1_9ACAR
MFILEESQLIEDTILDSDVLGLYKVLRANESSGNSRDLLELLSRDKFKTAIELLIEFQKLCGQELKLSPEQRESLLSRLNIEKNDCASLYLTVAATLNQLFVIDNFTGPAHDGDSLYNELPEIYKTMRNHFDYKSLTSDGYEVYHRIVNPWLLKAVQLCWTLLSNIGASRRLLELEFLVWKHRYLTIHLVILHEPSEVILKELNRIHEYIFDHHVINDIRENKTQLARFNTVALCCELVQSSLFRDAITSSRKIFDYASEISGISIEHTGVLGKRTRFQQNDIPQLVIRVSNANRDELQMLERGDKPLGLPKDIILDDDTLLPDISFVKDSEEGNSVCDEQDISPEAQLLMLTRLDFIMKTEVMEESLKDEWTLAYVRSIINSASIWSVKYKALAIRSTCEKKQMRKMDRALLQLEELIKETNTCKEDEANIRMQLFYSTLPLARWQMQRSLGDISFHLCLFKNALEVYTRIEYWEGIIKCYSALGETVKAENIIRQELAKQETPYLYCLLGDATENIEFYEKSWVLSKERFARAKKSIGTHYYVRKDYESAINNYEQALKASPSNISILSMLAYSCLITERFERAAECYRNLTYQDDGSFLAWNNLSKAYIKLNQKERALRTLREAIKCNYEEWKIWENFMLVAVEVGALDDVIIAWHRLIDIKGSHKDDQVMSALTYSILQSSYVKTDSKFMKLLGDALKLAGRISTTAACSSRVWVCYFRLLAREFDILKRDGTADGKPMTKFDIDSRLSKMINTLQRATPNTLILDTNWYQSVEKVDHVLNNYDELIDCYMLLLNLIGARNEIWTQWKYFKLSLTNTIKTLRRKGYNS